MQQDNGLDKDGNIKKQISHLKIKEDYLLFVEEFKEGIFRILEEKLHSLYICGSIPMGTSIPYKSDADFTIVIHEELSRNDYSKIEKFKIELLEKYSFITKIDTPSCLINDVLNFIDWGFWIKIVCFCIHGEDLGEKISPIKPSREFVIGYNRETESAVSSRIKKIEKEKDFSRIFDKTLKLLIRAAYTLIIEKDKSWYIDPNKCLNVIRKYYPQMSTVLNRAGEYLEKPEPDKSEALVFLNGFYRWIKQELKLSL
jgi:uncharacterized protein